LQAPFVVLRFWHKRFLHLTSNRSKDAFYAFAFWPEPSWLGGEKKSSQREGKDGDLRGKWVVNGWLGGICRVTHQSARMKNGQSAIRQIESKKNMAEMLLFQTANWLPGWLAG